MTEMNNQHSQYEFPTPTFGTDFSGNVDLPAPAAEPNEVIAIPTSEQAVVHTVEIFTSADPVDGEATKQQSRALQTEVYLDRGFIKSDDLDENHLHNDDYTDRSTYLYVRNGVKVATARYISANKKKGGLLSLPTAKNFEVDPDIIRTVANVDRLADIKSSQVIEISGLAARKHEGKDDTLDATITLYSRMLRDSLEQGHKLWLSNVDPAFVRYMGRMLGHDQVHKLGPKQEYMGPPTIPIAINPIDAVRSVLEGKESGSYRAKAYDIAREVLQGVDDRKIPSDLRTLLEEHGVEMTKYSDIKRIVKDPKMIAYAGIVAYSSARAFPAAGVEQFDGSTAILWTIDVATAVPYTWGMIETFTPQPRSRMRRAVGAVVAATSFMAPYAYFAAEGQDYPPSVNAIVGGLIGTAVLKEVVVGKLTKRKELRLTEGLRSGQPSSATAKNVVEISSPETTIPTVPFQSPYPYSA